MAKAKTEKPAKATKKVATKKATKEPGTEKRVVQRRVDPNETVNMKKVLSRIQKAGNVGYLQSAVKEELATHFPGWYYFNKLRDNGDVVLNTHNMRVYAVTKGTKFVPPAEKVATKAPRAAKAAKPAKGIAKAVNGKAATPRKVRKPKAAKATGKPPAAGGGAAEHAGDDLL